MMLLPRLLLLSVIGASRTLPPLDPPMEDPELNPILRVSQRNGIRDSNRPWLVYYKLWKGLGNERKAFIKGAMKTLEEVSCLRFVEACDGQWYSLIIVESSERCYPYIARSGTRSKLYIPYSLNSNCYNLSTLMDNLFVALESVHESLNYRPPDFKYVAEKDIVEDLGVEYDKGSIMHSPATSNANSGAETVVLMDQVGALSKSSISRLNKMYNCRMD